MIKNVNDLTKSDFAFSGANQVIKRGFFNYSQVMGESAVVGLSKNDKKQQRINIQFIINNKLFNVVYCLL